METILFPHLEDCALWKAMCIAVPGIRFFEVYNPWNQPAWALAQLPTLSQLAGKRARGSDVISFWTGSTTPPPPSSAFFILPTWFHRKLVCRERHHFSQKMAQLLPLISPLVTPLQGQPHLLCRKQWLMIINARSFGSILEWSTDFGVKSARVGQIV